MVSDVHLVVGDAYERFAGNDGVMTYHRAVEWLQARSAKTPARLVLGQGLEFVQRSVIAQKAAQTGVHISTVQEPAPGPTTHKHLADNVMITNPIKLKPGHYTSEMTVSEKFDRLSDHVTGQHVGGMLLVEAARQLATAVLECEYGSDGNKLGLIWDGLTSRFLAFAFPVPTEMRATIVLRPEKSRPKQIGLTVNVDIAQAGEPIAAVGIEGIVLQEPEMLVGIEERRAKAAIKRELEQFVERAPVNTAVEGRA